MTRHGATLALGFILFAVSGCVTQEEHDRTLSELRELRLTNENLERSASYKDEEISDLEDQVSRLRADNSDLEDDVSRLENERASFSSSAWSPSFPSRNW